MASPFRVLLPLAKFLYHRRGPRAL